MSEDRKTEQDVLRELDAEIAERVMGWVRVTGQTALAAYAYRRPDGHIVHPYSAPEYSTKIEAAMEVVEAMRTRGYRWNAQTPRGKGWQIQCYRPVQRERGEKLGACCPKRSAAPRLAR